jgi:hypothetical protein
VFGVKMSENVSKGKGQFFVSKNKTKSFVFVK